MAAATPPGRDRVVDLLRGASLAIVVAGHTLMAVVVWNHGVPRVDNLLGLVPELEPLTWVLQVIPVFFAAGAIANRSSLHAAKGRHEAWRIWMWARTRRLARPVLYYLVIWMPIVFVLSSVMGAAARPLERLSTQLLWFLGVYVLIVATAALQVRVARGGLWSVGALVLLVAGVDAGRFHGGGDAVASLNFFLVFFLAAGVGLVVRDLEGLAADCSGSWPSRQSRSTLPWSRSGRTRCRWSGSPARRSRMSGHPHSCSRCMRLR